MGEPFEEHSEHPREFPRFEVNAYVDYTGNEVLLFHRIQNTSMLPARFLPATASRRSARWSISC